MFRNDVHISRLLNMKVEKTIVCLVLIICFAGLMNPVSPSVPNPSDTTAIFVEEVLLETSKGEHVIETKSKHNLSEADGYSEEFQRQHDVRASQIHSHKTATPEKNQRNL